MNPLTRRLLKGISAFLSQPDHLQKLPPDLGEDDKDILRKVLPFTMTGADRVAALISATRHISANKVPGAIVECGVWRGGSAMAAMLTLSSMSDETRNIYLYDTFEGMPEPTTEDVDFDGLPAARQFKSAKASDKGWCYASLEDVQDNLKTISYPTSRIHFVRGRVQETIPANVPEQIALLRLDTDWYESTKHELEHLFPLLHPRGILIVDDYGHWKGARKAVDEFFQDKINQYYFHRIDYTGRLILRTFS